MKLSTMIRACALAAVFAGLVATAEAAPSYRLTRLGDDPDSPGYRTPTALDINNKGEILLAIENATGIRSYVWKDGTLTDVGDLAGGNASYSVASAINDRSDIAGTSLSDALPSFRPFIKRNGESEPEDLGTFLDGSAVFAGDMNLWRQILLGVEVSGGDDSYIQHGQNLTRLQPLAGGDHTSAAMINLWGTVIGTSENAQGTRVAVIWRQGQPTEFGLPPNGVNSRGVGINDLGYATAEVAYADGTRGVVLRHQGTLTQLPVPSGGQINNRNQVIGNILNEAPLLWEDGVVYNINDLIAPDDPLRPYVTLVRTTLHNDRGQLIVYGSDSRQSAFARPPYLLTPVSN